MTTQLPLRCQCGAVRGTALAVSPERGTYGVCYCDDCQAFGRFLGKEALLDELGGSHIYQMTPAQLRIDAGAEHLCCMRLSEKGMLRWFAGCCRSPIANTMPWARLPFVGMLISFVDPAAAATLRERALGRPVAFAFGRNALGGRPAHAPEGVPVAWMLRTFRMLARGFVLRQHTPTALFDHAGKPVVAPQVLSPAERDALRPRHQAVTT